VTGRLVLAGRTVLVTRPADQSASLVTLLRRLGAKAILAPAIEIVPARSAALTRALRELQHGDFAWMTLTSRATVDMLASRLPGPRAIGATKVAAIGDSTRSSAFGWWARRDPDLVIRRSPTGLARSFPRLVTGCSAPGPTSRATGFEDARPEGLDPTRVDAYRTRFPRSLPEAREERCAAARST
jgi:uroporphyrinogen-III synthase